MKETTFGTLEEKSQDMNSCVIDSVPYTVPDYVKDFLSRRKVGDKVEFSFTEGEKGRRLTKIMRVDRNEKTAPVKESAKVPPPQLHHVRVIKVNEVAIKYDNLSKDPRLSGVRTISLTPAQFGEFTNRGIKDGDEIDIVVDAQGYCTLPDAKFTAARDILRENINKLEAEANAKANSTAANTTPIEKATVTSQGKPIVDPVGTPGKEETEVKANSPITDTSPQVSPPGGTAPLGKETENQDTARPTPSPLPAPEFATLTIVHTVNLGNYESLKVGIEGQAVDREELEQFLDDTLSRYGRNHPATMEAIDTYRRRVLPGVKV